MGAKKQGQTAPLSDDRWDDVRVFLALYREKNLGDAGKRLGLDRSTMSRRLSAFEAALGGRLFERTRDGLVATRRAIQMLTTAESIEGAYARLLRDASANDSEPEGRVRVSAAPGVADKFVAPALVRLQARYPRLSIELDSSTRALDLSRHEADLALRSAAPEGAELVITKVLHTRWLVAGAPSLVKALGRVQTWSALSWITWDRDLASYGPSAWLERHARGAHIALRTSYFSAQLAAASSGLGVILVPEPYLGLSGLTPVRYAKALTASTQRWPEDTVWLVAHRTMREVPRVAAVWDFLAEEMRKHAPKSTTPR